MPSLVSAIEKYREEVALAIKREKFIIEERLVSQLHLVKNPERGLGLGFSERLITLTKEPPLKGAHFSRKEHLGFPIGTQVTRPLLGIIRLARGFPFPIPFTGLGRKQGRNYSPKALN